jgi:predicted 2-oxoglutarate/Fe(II)-dependent dioxygenase YbiX
LLRAGRAQDTVWFDGQDVGVRVERQRLVTVLVQMSRCGLDYGGGSLQFRTRAGEWRDAPRGEGAAVLFPSHQTLHRVRSVAWGRRDVLVWWVWGWRL